MLRPKGSVIFILLLEEDIAFRAWLSEHCIQSIASRKYTGGIRCGREVKRPECEAEGRRGGRQAGGRQRGVGGQVDAQRQSVDGIAVRDELAPRGMSMGMV